MNGAAQLGAWPWWSVPLLLALWLACAGGALWLLLRWRRAAEAGRQSAVHYAAVLAQTSDAVLFVEPDTERVLEANLAAQRLLGYGADELAGVVLRDVVAAPAAVPAPAQLLSGGPRQPFTASWLLRARDGTLVDAEVTGGCVISGAREAWCLTLRDLRAQLQAQEQLRAAQARFQALFERAGIGIALLDLQGRALETNAALQAMLGFDADQLRGMAFTDVSHPDNTASDRELFRELAAGRRDHYQVERRFVARDGRALWAELIVSLVRSPLGEAQFAIAMVEEITERRRADEERARRAGELRALYETSLALHAQTNLGLLLQTIVRRAADLLGAHMGGLYLLDAAGTQLQLVVNYNLPNLQLGSVLRLGEGLSGRVAQSGEPEMLGGAYWEGRASTGSTRPLQRVVSVPLKLAGRVIGVLTITDDRQAGRYGDDEVRLLTLFADQATVAVENARLYEAAQRELAERRRIEDALRRSMGELQARNDELDAFAHTVAHDLKNPLGPIVGIAEVLAQDYATMAPDELEHYLRGIAQAGVKMGNIIDELLLLAQVRKTEVARVPLAMERIVADACARLDYMVRDYRADIVLPGEWPPAVGHPPWVEEVWVNYLSNAIKYGGPQPRVELGSTSQPDGQVRFWVRDRGPGLSAEQQARLFTPFVRMSQVRATGHGLGLSIARRIVEKLGGEIGVESTPGAGSTFFFTLPPAPAGDLPRAPREEQVAPA